MAVSVKDTVEMTRNVGSDVLGAIAKARGTIAIATLALAGLSSIGIAKMLSPSAVAENSDDFILNETLKTSLAKSRQDNEVLKRNKKLQSMQGVGRLPHDKFV